MNFQYLPTPRHFAASLVSALSTSTEQQDQISNPLNNATTNKDIFLTLHVLFQNELLPALDLLDRGLVTRLQLSHDKSKGDNSDQGSAQAAGIERGTVAAGKGQQVYYVRSAQQQSSRNTSRYRNAVYEHMTYYEVRLDAWSCSCPAFAFSAFSATAAEAPGCPEIEEKSSSRWAFGGLTLGTDMPICKHLLACVLVEHSSMFAHMVEERVVSIEELAGWAAGWGD